MIRLFHFILSHSIFISFCAAGLSLQTLQLLHLPLDTFLLSFIFFATLCGYNAYWIVSRFSFNTKDPLADFITRSRSSFIVLFAALAGMLFCMMRLHLVMYNSIITFLLLGLYAVPLLPIRQLHFTRKAGFVKTVLLALAWTIVTILIPMQVPIYKIGMPAILLFVNRFLFMLLLCIIFDKRDAAMDKIRGLQSLATDVKPALLHWLIAFILLVYTAASYRLKAYGITSRQAAALIATGCIALLVYIASLKKRGYIFYYFIVDGLMFLSAVFTCIATVEY